jgi:hypothetical protein
MDVEAFIARWTGREGGAERANYQMFLSELCDVLGVDRPQPADATRANNDYVFERAVSPRESEGTSAPKRIDLYKRDAFILEAKQSRLPGKDKAVPGQLSLLAEEPEQPGRRSTGGRWDVLMRNARAQAEEYVFRLPADHPAPPFVIVCDVGHAMEFYADFSGTGRAYSHFPDRKSFRVWLEDLRSAEVRERLRCIWTDPHALDPTKRSARVTREIANRLAQVSRALEAKHPPEEVAHFLMRCIFTMFAEDVELLPKSSFTQLLEECLDGPASFAPLLEDLWAKMDEPDYKKRFFSGFKTHLRWFNGNLFKNARAFPLAREEIGELLAAARHDWRHVEPAIFGSLLEQALDPAERRRLGAHYTPRAYVERLVDVTIMEPLRQDWAGVLTKVEDARDHGDPKAAAAAVRKFHHALCATRVLDPACGTGNFLYVSLELMKRLEGEVLETLAQLGETASIGLETVDPHQFLGLELNPRAAAIAELVLWIGFLQQHYRIATEHPSEPILKAFHNITQMDAVLTWDGYPLTSPLETGERPVDAYPNPRPPVWPAAEFIIGNPPFIGGKDLRSRMAPGYAEALWAAHPAMNESADFVMYWWDCAAESLTRAPKQFRAGSRTGEPLVTYPPRRFGFVTTNSISQVFQRRVMERHLNAKAPVSLLFAIPDHPWTKATKDSAAVRIAMTVAAVGSHEGVLWETTGEAGLDTDEPRISFSVLAGRLNSDLTVGVDVTRAGPLLANEGVCSPGVKLHGAGFIVTPGEAEHLGLGRREGLARHIRPYRNGRDLVGHSRGAMVIDLDGLSSDDVRQRFPEVYQHVLERVKPERDKNNEPYRRENWWLFGRRNTLMRGFVEALPKYIATVETSKYRTFQFLSAEILPDNMLVNIGSADAFHLAILSSRIHTTWAPVLGGWLGFGNDPRYSKSRCFDPFPFPDPPEDLKSYLRALGEELDATRKRVLAEHPDLTLTGLYNVLEKLKAGTPLTPADEGVKQRGLVLILKELHQQIDDLTADAYGWPRDLSDEQILERLVALNAERAAEEAAGHVRWLRPDYQIPRFAKGAAAKSGELDLGAAVTAIDAGLPAFPADRGEQPLAVLGVLTASGRPMDAAGLSRAFKRGGKRIEQRVVQVLETLTRYGRITALPNGTYVARRAA